MVRRRGWTLLEALVALGLAGLILTVVSSALSSTLRETTRDNQRAACQGALLIIGAQLQDLMDRTSAMGLAWTPATADLPAVLATHGLAEGPGSGDPVWEAVWRCLSWDPKSHGLVYRRVPPGVAAPPTTHVAAATPAELLQIRQLTTLPEKRLSSDVSLFDYKLEDGPLARVRVQLDIPGQVQPEHLELNRRYFLTNHQ